MLAASAAWGEIPVLLDHPRGEQLAGIGTGPLVSVVVHPVSSLGLGGFDTPSLQGGPDEQRSEELQLILGLGPSEGLSE